MEGECGDDGQSAKGLAPGPWGKRGWGWGMGEEEGPMPRPTRNGGPDAEAPERRRGAKTGAVWREEAVPRWASAGSEWTRAPERASEFAHHQANPSDTITAGVQTRHPGILPALSWMSSGPRGLLA